MNRRVLFYVQHLLGIGHLKRAATLARALAREGFEVTLVSGGETVPVLDQTGFDFVQLQPVRSADRYFSGLRDEAGRPVDTIYLNRRRAMLLDCFARIRPHVVMTELFPFGRRRLRDEFMALIEAGEATGAKIICSVRDILVEKGRAEREAEMVETALRWFDAILVHGDPALIPFEATFPRAHELAVLIHYTGYVVEDAPLRDADLERGEVLVSAGSSATGESLLRMAMAARAQTSLADVPWRLLVGHGLGNDIFAAIRAEAPDGITVERARPDFTALLRHCALSISQGGYNTTMEVLASGARAVVVPYAGGNETEQTVRARLLAERGLVQQCSEGNLSVETLVGLIERARMAPARQLDGIDLGGAANSARIVAGLVDRTG